MIEIEITTVSSRYFFLEFVWKKKRDVMNKRKEGFVYNYYENMTVRFV